jgi:hypothetical protein
MSVRRRVLLLSIIFSALGISVSIILIALAGGFSGSRSSILNPPTQTDLWTVGKTPLNNFTLKYVLTSSEADETKGNATVWLNFSKLSNSNWNVNVSIRNNTNHEDFEILLSQNEFSRIGSSDADKSLSLLDDSIFEIREIARGSKYLVVGALWDKILLDSIEVPVKITDRVKLSIPAGNFDAFVLSYDAGPKKSQIWINKNLPLPIRALVYDDSGQVRYSYNLVDIEKPF